VQHRGKWITKSRLKRIEARRGRLQKVIRERADWKNAWQLKTRHFELTTNTSHQLATEIGDAIDACYDTLKSVYSARGDGGKIPVDVFATFDQFAAVSAAEGFPIRSQNIAGYFWRKGNQAGIRCYYIGSLEETLKTLYHEIAHLTLYKKVGGTTPTWSNEGLAVFFEDLHRTKKGFDIQTIPWHRLWSLQSTLKKTPNGPTLSHLVGLSRERYTAQFYPQVWALIHFLLFGENGKYRNNFNRYYALLEKEPGRMSNGELFHKAFGKHPDELQTEWVRHIQSIKPESAQDFIGASRTAARYKVNLQEARDYAAQAIELDPKNWQAHAALAQALAYAAMLANQPGQRAQFISDSLDAYATAAEVGRFTKLRKKRGAGNYPRIQLHISWALAHALAGNYETAFEMLENVLDVDETSADAYRVLALMQIIATNTNVRDLDQAAEDLSVADDFGRAQMNYAVRALLHQARGKKAEAQQALKRAAELDRFGIGSVLYPALKKRYAQQPQQKS
jgi:tetratricopeptide (TPR) repeat protein